MSKWHEGFFVFKFIGESADVGYIEWEFVILSLWYGDLGILMTDKTWQSKLVIDTLKVYTHDE